MKKYESGFTVKTNDGKCSMWDMEWLFDKENTTESKLVFMGVSRKTPCFSYGDIRQKYF